MLETVGVRKSYADVVALAGIDLEIASGQILGLLGPNGAGKSTLVACISGLVRPDAGEIRIGGIDALRERSRVMTLLGVAPQDTGVYPDLSARENLAFFGKIAGLHGTALRSRIEDVAEALDLQDLLGRRAGELSGGEQRRVHTAMALLHRPRLLLLDEPTAGVDVATRQRLLEIVKELARDGTAVCYTTHYLPEVEVLSDSVGILRDGRIISCGSLADLKRTSGGSVVEVEFQKEAPDAAVLGGGLPFQLSKQGSFLRLLSDEPTEALGMLLTRLPAGVREDIRSIEILHPSLETIFLALTGRRYEGGGSDAATKQEDAA